MIRLLKPADAEEYFQLRLEALKENPEAFATSYEEVVNRPNPIEEYKESFGLEGQYHFGAFVANKLVGMVTLLPEAKEKLKHKANIFAMYITPFHRGKGIASALLQTAIKQAKELEGIIKINLTVVSINKGAKALYKKFDFETYGLEEKAIKVKNVYFDEEYMTLNLDK